MVPQSLLVDPPLLLVSWGWGHQSQCPTPSAPRFLRLWRFDPCAPRESLVLPPADLELATGLNRGNMLPWLRGDYWWIINLCYRKYWLNMLLLDWLSNLIQLGGLGSTVSSLGPGRARPPSDIWCILGWEKLLVRAILCAYSREKYLKFDKLAA